ncbi:MAG: hypothetical protein JSW28_08550 [Thermoplasmata archaeon]|nr:MAG: hypothetical protein JSW28_08550 [Thermoplasmata archaeon]
MWKNGNAGEENPDIPNRNIGGLRRIKGLRFSFEHFRIDGQSFYSIVWEDGA